MEYAKETPEDILIRISVSNRASEPASLHVLPVLWFRSTWTWWPGAAKPSLRQVSGAPGGRIIAASHAELGDCWLYIDGDVPLLFTENETNTLRIFKTPNASPYVKDGINDYLVRKRAGTVNAAGTGTKAAAHFQLVHQVRDWFSGAAAYFGWMSDKAASQKTRSPEGCAENGPAAALLLSHVHPVSQTGVSEAYAQLYLVGKS